MVEWYRPLRRLIENAPRGALRNGRPDQGWLRSQRDAGRVSNDDIAFSMARQFHPDAPFDLRDPRVTENMFGSGPLGLEAGTAARSPLRMPGGELEVGTPHYRHYHLHSPDGDNYREILLRSPDLPPATGNHFNTDIPGGRQVPWSTNAQRTRPDDVLGWLRMQDRMPPGSGAAGPWSWIDEAQSDRFAQLRAVQRRLRDVENDLREGRGSVPVNEARRQTLRYQEAGAIDAMAPWENTWQDMLFRRGMWDAADNNRGRLAWTSGLEQGIRTPLRGGATGGLDEVVQRYAPQYDQYFPRLARREARRLGLPADSVGSGYETRPVWELRDTRPPERGGQRSWFANDEEGLDDTATLLLRPEDYATEMRRVRGSGSWEPPERRDLAIRDMGDFRIPYHYFQFDPGALERAGLPYFRRGGSV